MREPVGTHLVGRGELGPGLVGPAVVVLGVRGLHVLVEAQDLPGLQFGHRGPLGELRRRRKRRRRPIIESGASLRRSEGFSGKTEHRPFW